MGIHEFERYQKDLKNARAKYRRAIESRNETARQDAAHAQRVGRRQFFQGAQDVQRLVGTGGTHDRD